MIKLTLYATVLGALATLLTGCESARTDSSPRLQLIDCRNGRGQVIRSVPLDSNTEKPVQTFFELDGDFKIE